GSPSGGDRPTEAMGTSQPWALSPRPHARLPATRKLARGQSSTHAHPKHFARCVASRARLLLPIGVSWFSAGPGCSQDLLSQRRLFLTQLSYQIIRPFAPSNKALH